MRRTITRLSVLVAVTAALAGCGGNDDTSGTASGEKTSASASASESASPSESSSTGTLAGGCEPPTSNVRYKDGSATLDVTAGPDTGQYELVLDRSEDNAFAKDDQELTGNWISADKQAVLFIDIEGTDPCQPDAFTSIGTEGASGPVFVDFAHTQCAVALTSFSDQGAQGTFDCKGLTGGGKNLERDAQGTFTLLP